MTMTKKPLGKTPVTCTCAVAGTGVDPVTRAKHGLCGAHLLRDLADVAVVYTETA